MLTSTAQRKLFSVLARAAVQLIAAEAGEDRTFERRLSGNVEPKLRVTQ